MSSKHQLMSQVSLPSMVCQDHKDAQIRLLLLSGCVFVIFRGGGGERIRLKKTFIRKIIFSHLYFVLVFLLFVCFAFARKSSLENRNLLCNCDDDEKTTNCIYVSNWYRD